MTYTLALRRFLEGKEEKPSRKKQRAKKEMHFIYGLMLKDNGSK